MEMFAPERPKLPNGQPALLIENSAIPHVIVAVQPEGYVKLAVMLRNYSDDARSYSYRFADFTIEAISSFFEEYISDPEKALLKYFDWEPRPTTTKPNFRPNVVLPPPDRSNTFDLL